MVLVCATVKLHDVQERKCVPILVVIEDHADLIEQDLGVIARGRGRHAVVEDQASLSGNGLKDVLMLG